MLPKPYYILSRFFLRPFRADRVEGWIPRVKALGFGSLAPSEQAQSRTMPFPSDNRQLTLTTLFLTLVDNLLAGRYWHCREYR